MKWIKASEREPEATSGYAKDLVYKQHRDIGTRLMVCTVSQFLDILKYRVKEKFEWLDETFDSSKDQEISSLNEILKQKMELLVKANERIEELEKQLNGS